MTLQKTLLTTEKVISLLVVLKKKKCNRRWLEGRLHATRTHTLSHTCFIASCEPAAYPKMTLKTCLKIADGACTVSMSTKMKTHCFKLCQIQRGVKNRIYLFSRKQQRMASVLDRGRVCEGDSCHFSSIKSFITCARVCAGERRVSRIKEKKPNAGQGKAADRRRRLGAFL